MNHRISKTLSERRIRKDISWIFSELSKGNYSNIDSFDIEDVFNILERVKINNDSISMLIGIFWTASNPKLKSSIAISILYYSIGNNSVILDSTKLSAIFEYMSTINPEELDELLVWKIRVSWVTSQSQRNRVRDFIQLWKKNRYLEVRVSQLLDKRLFQAAND